MRVKSEIDLSFKLIIFFTLFTITVSSLLVPRDELWLMLMIVIPTNLFLLWMMWGTWYELRDDYLLCVSGPFREKIFYKTIKHIELTENMLSSMALSRKRIEIRQHHKNFFTGTTYISPENREDFYFELKSLCRFLDSL